MSEPFYLEIVAPSTTVAGGGSAGAASRDVKLENGTVQHAYVWTGDRTNGNNDIATYANAKARLDEGRIPLTVQNNEVIKVLKTGGKGRTLFITVGAMGLATGAFFFLKKKKEEEAEAE